MSDAGADRSESAGAAAGEAGVEGEALLDVVGAVQVELLSEIVGEFEEALRDAAGGDGEPPGLASRLENRRARSEPTEHEAVVRAIERGSGLARLILLMDQLRAAVDRKA